MNTLIWYPKCSTCQKAHKYLNTLHIEHMTRHIVEEKLSVEELTKLYKRSGLPLKKFFNTSGLKYKELNLKDKLPAMNEEEQLQLLSSDGMLIKRPILITDTTVLVGFKESDYNRLGK